MKVIDLAIKRMNERMRAAVPSLVEDDLHTSEGDESTRIFAALVSGFDLGDPGEIRDHLEDMTFDLIVSLWQGGMDPTDPAAGMGAFRSVATNAFILGVYAREVAAKEKDER